MEKRVAVKGYEWYYEVSTYWNIKSLERTYCVLKKLRSGFIEKVTINKKGKIISTHKKDWYVKVSMTNKKWLRKTYSVHRIVYLSFNNINLQWKWWDKKNCVCHINDIRDDNRLDNLFIGSQQENVNDMMRKWRCKKITKLHTQKMVLKAGKIDFSIAEMIREDYKKTKSIYITGRKFNISYATVSRIKNNIIWKPDYWM